ncbi:type IV pilus assembly protein PilC [Motilibacter peucedani]|uniref:Type IV pilus assembly protein PilC n=1 Tax=Motilibacter peucedani TaxID=598650 RepID=A0A420XSF8_9ACTN|nr:type II secretion system F family protein [Motilibacter peucedani]RKS77751.1 type IV pilus assembly protein PilC [Motilibacter peucedani]
MSTLTFEYVGRDTAGKAVKGKVEADSASSAAGQVRQLGVTASSITEASRTGLSREVKLPSFGAKVKLKDLAVFSRQFSTMINSGLSLLRALVILENQTENEELAKVLGQVRADVETGVSLSSAMGKHVRIFPPLMVNMIRAGEVGGFLDSVLLQIAENFESEVKLRGKVKAAMTYPVVVFVLSIVMSIGMLLFIVPTFSGMFASLGGTLPLPTRVLMAMSAFLKVGIIPLTLLAVGFAVFIGKVKHTDRFHAIVDPVKLKMPVFGPLFHKIALSRFSRNLGTMLRSGVPILQALDIVADTTGNVVIGAGVRGIQESVRRGDSIAKPLEQHPAFPSMIVQMLAVGEDTGALDSMLLKISDFYDQEVEATTESLTALIEPLMIAFLGAVVGSMIVGLYMPIFKIFDLVGKQA